MTLFSGSECRYSHGATTILGILPGTRKKEEGERPRIGCVLKLVSRELGSLAEHGVDVYDAHTETDINVRVMLLTTGADYRGIEDMLRLSGAPRVQHGCYKCWTAGSKGVHKYNYPGAWTWLGDDDPLRQAASQLNPVTNATGQRLQRNTNELRPALRSKAELAAMTVVGAVPHMVSIHALL